MGYGEAAFEEEEVTHQKNVVGRLLRFWDDQNINKNGEFMGINLLFQDEKSTVIHGFIPAQLDNQFRGILEESEIFSLENFEVGKSRKNYKLTEHPTYMSFLTTTTIVKITNFEATIEREKFMLRNAENLTALADTNIELPDVVGQIEYVQGPDLEDQSSTKRLLIRFMLNSNILVYLALWDDAASAFRSYLASNKTKNTVMLVTTFNPKIYGGYLHLTSTPGTRIYLDQRIAAINEFTNRHKRLNSCAPLQLLTSVWKMGGVMLHVPCATVKSRQKEQLCIAQNALPNFQPKLSDTK